MTTMRHAPWILLATLVTLLPVVAVAQDGPEFRAISLGLRSVEITDEDDDLDNDEPYLLAVRFRMRFDAAGKVLPDTVDVSKLLGSHNNLNTSGGDDWADEGHTYELPTGYDRVIEEVLPIDEAGWVLGMVLVYMEEDRFEPWMVEKAADRLVEVVDVLIRSSSDPAADVERIVREGADEILARLDLMSLIPVVLMPDDVGGVRMVLVATTAGLPDAGAAGNQQTTNVLMFAGNMPNQQQWQTVQAALQNPTVRNASDLGRMTAALTTLGQLGKVSLKVASREDFVFDFPGDQPVALPRTIRYSGHAKLNGWVRVADVPGDDSTDHSLPIEERALGTWHFSDGANQAGTLFLYRLPDQPRANGDRLGTFYPATYPPVYPQGPLGPAVPWNRRLNRSGAKRVIGGFTNNVPGPGGFRNRLFFSFNDKQTPSHSPQSPAYSYYLFSGGEGPDTMVGSISRSGVAGFGYGHARKGSFLAEPLPPAALLSLAHLGVSGWEQLPGRWRLVYDGFERILDIYTFAEAHEVNLHESSERVQLRAWFEDAPDKKMWFSVANDDPNNIFLSPMETPPGLPYAIRLNDRSLEGRVQESPRVVCGTDRFGPKHGFYMIKLGDAPPVPAPPVYDTSAAGFNEFDPDRPLFVTGAVLHETASSELDPVEDAKVTFHPSDGGEAVFVRSASDGRFFLHRPKGRYRVVAEWNGRQSETRQVEIVRDRQTVVLHFWDPATEARVRENRASQFALVPDLPDQITVGEIDRNPIIRRGAAAASDSPDATDTRETNRSPRGRGWVDAGPQPEPPGSPDPQSAGPQPEPPVVRGHVLVRSGAVRGGYAAVDGARIEWIDRAGARRATSSSHKGGRFSANLPIGVYQARVDAPRGYKDRSFNVRVTESSEMQRFVLEREIHEPPPTDTTAGGQVPTGTPLLVESQGQPSLLSISGHVHAPGSRYLGEAELLDSNRKLLRSLRVTSRGSYTFTGLAPGTYYVRLKRAPDEFYSKINPAIRKVQLTKTLAKNVDFTLTAGTNSADRQPTGTVVLAKNPDEPSEVSISGKVHADGSRNFGKAELLDGNRKLLRTMRVAADGSYAFTRLKPGTYHVRLNRVPDEFYTKVDPPIRKVQATKSSVKNVDFTLR